MALGLAAKGQDLVKKNLPGPGRKIGAELELVKLAPHDDFAFLENVLRVLGAGNEAGHVDAKPFLVFAEQAEKSFGAFVCVCPGIHPLIVK